MSTWGEQLHELGELQRQAQARAAQEGTPTPGSASPYDTLRRRHLEALSKRTGRAAIVYATAWLEDRDGLSAEVLSIGLGDKGGFMEAVSNVQERELDLFLHSPGGEAEAAEAIMDYLRTRFDHIRAIVPLAAMSAATMMALACDEIVMGAHSQLGPIDPQLTIHTPEGPRSAPRSSDHRPVRAREDGVPGPEEHRCLAPDPPQLRAGTDRRVRPPARARRGLRRAVAGGSHVRR